MTAYDAVSKDFELTGIIRLGDPGADPERLDELTQAVRADLLETHISAASLVQVMTPDGARAVDGNQIGELIVVLGSSTVVLRSVIQVLRAWRDRRPERTVELTVGKDQLKLNDATREQQDRAVEAFIAAIRKK
ncbi:hypothetical protein [Microbispora hainanensis]|uniref:hypothetical protein n=1 Tax=Microbispora hainanensis TaxID=568844 RepID=UPI00324E32A0